jgi:endonuclease YncB( thermonuclease family)
LKRFAALPFLAGFLGLMGVVGAPAAALDRAPSALARTGESARVAYVVDGDTISLTDGRRVRLLQIDTPELGSGECYSRAARTALLNLLPVNTRAELEVDPLLDRVDRFGRLLRYVRRDGANVNLELVRAGAATPYFYRGERGRYAQALLAAARQAKAAKRGLWRACPSTPFDPYRQATTGRSGPPVKTP